MRIDKIAASAISAANAVRAAHPPKTVARMQSRDSLAAAKKSSDTEQQQHNHQSAE